MNDREAAWSALLRAANAGDGRAYSLFLHAVTPVLRGIVRARGHGLAPETQEDIMQEILIAIHRKRHTWDDRAPLLPWLYAIARYKTVDAFRTRGRAVHVDIADLAEVLAADAPDPMAVRDSDRLIGRLDQRSASIVRGMGIEGESAADLARRLDMTEGAVRVALHRALRRLAAIAGGRGQ